jgi:PAS domain S-box-containing protein
MDSKECILVVDDDEGIRKSLSLILKKKGYLVESAGTGAEALSIAKDRTINLTLLDIKLPDTEGIQIIAPLLETNLDMSIFMITGFASVESAVDALTAGASGYITKPIDLDEMLVMIQTAVEHQHLVTDVKRAEAELRVSLAKYKVIFESFPIAITVSDKLGNIIESNWRAMEILGLSPEEQSRRTIDGTEWHVIRPDGTPMKADEYASVRALKENHLVQNVEMGIVKENNAVTWINVTAAPIPIKDYGVAIAYNDITERKRVDEEIIFKNIILSTQQETTLDGILIIDEHGKIISFNQHFTDMWDIPNTIIASGEDILAIQSVLTKVKDPSGFLERVSYLYEHKDEKSREEVDLVDGRVFDRFSAPMYGKDGRYYGRVWYFRDITERKRTESALRESEERFRELFNKANDAIYLYEYDPMRQTGQLIEVNEVACQMLQYTHDEFIQMPVENIRAPDERETFRDHMKSLMVVGHLTFETRHQRKDSTWVPIEVNAHLFMLQGKSVVLSIARDITQRKKTEEEVQKSLVQIESDLEQMALFNDQIRNPLAVMIALLDREQESPVNARIRGQVYKINDLITTLDRQYSSSEKVREFLRKHYDFYRGEDQ